MGKRELVALLCLSSWCLVVIVVQWLFLTVPWVGLLCVIVAFPDDTRFFLFLLCMERKIHITLEYTCEFIHNEESS